MAKKKYKTASDPMPKNPIYQCTKRRCKWQGKDEEKSNIKTDPVYACYEHICPNCGNNEFYILLNN